MASCEVLHGARRAARRTAPASSDEALRRMPIIAWFRLFSHDRSGSADRHLGVGARHFSLAELDPDGWRALRTPTQARYARRTVVAIISSDIATFRRSQRTNNAISMMIGIGMPMSQSAMDRMPRLLL